MIKEYFRPKKLNEAIDILGKNALAIPMGGGTSLGHRNEDISVVDLQDLDLSYIRKEDDNFDIGSMTTLEEIYKFFQDNGSINRALKIEGSKNQRIQGSLGGFLRLAGGRSPLLTCFLTLNCLVFYAEEAHGTLLSEFLKVRDSGKKLITHISIEDPAGLLFESVSRSPLDLPIVCCAVYNGGIEIRAAVGGFGDVPKIVPKNYFVQNNNVELSKYLLFSTDEWASSNYRTNITQIILNRLIDLSKKGDQ